MIYFVIIYGYILMAIYVITLLAIIVVLFGLTQYGMFSKKGHESYKELIRKNSNEEFHNSYKVMKILESEAAIQTEESRGVRSGSNYSETSISLQNGQLLIANAENKCEFEIYQELPVNERNGVVLLGKDCIFCAFPFEK